MRYGQEFIESGALSEETYKEIAEKYNAPKELVDRILKNDQLAMERQAEIDAEPYVADIGGYGQYKAALKWASDNLTEAEAKDYNAAINSSDDAVVHKAVKGLYNKFKDSTRGEPKLVSGKPGGASGGDVFTSQTEVIRAIQDPRYQSDTSYQRNVESKIVRSQKYLN